MKSLFRYISTQGTTSAASTVTVQARNPDGSAVNEPIFLRARVCDADAFPTATNATIAAINGSSLVETHTSGKDKTFKSSVLAAAVATLTIAGVVVNGETVTLGSRVYEFDTNGTRTLTAGRVRADISAAATKSQGTLRLDTIPTAGDLMTIGTRTFVFVASGAGNEPGEISVGANYAAAYANILAAINGSDGFNTAHSTVSAAAGTNTPATTTLTQSGTPVDGVTYTIGNKVYTAKDTLTPTEGQVLIGGSAANFLINLKAAVNHTGTPGTDYSCAAAHTQVTATTLTTSTLVFSATILAATGGNAATQNLLASTETSGNGAFGAATFLGAIDKIVLTARAGGVAGDLLATTETFTPANNTFDAATLGTTTAGVDCLAADAVTALALAITTDASAICSGTDGAGNTVVCTALTQGTAGNALASTETMANGSFGGSVFAGGSDNLPGRIDIELTNATAEKVTLRFGPALVSPLADVDYNVVQDVTHAA